MAPCPNGASDVALHFKVPRPPPHRLTAPVSSVLSSARGSASEEACIRDGPAQGQLLFQPPQAPPSVAPGGGSPSVAPLRADAAAGRKAQLPRARTPQRMLAAAGRAAGGAAAAANGSAAADGGAADDDGTAPAAGKKRSVRPERIGARFVDAVAQAMTHPQAGWFQARAPPSGCAHKPIAVKQPLRWREPVSHLLCRLRPLASSAGDLHNNTALRVCALNL